MKVQVVLPVPMDSEETWKLFKPFLQRFADTWRQFPPRIRCTLFLVTQGADATQELYDMFSGLPIIPERYDKGMDLGAQQYIARVSDDAFQVNMTSRCYFHRDGWLARMVRARNEHGPALYGLTASNEGGHFHLCTRGHSYDVDDFKLYPHDITSRDQGVFVELGDGCLLDWFGSIGRKSYIVDWTGCYECNQQYLGSHNTYRSNDQYNVLFWDKHTQSFADADPPEKERLRNLMLGTTPTCG